jgi:RNA polymerase sigma-70 factor (ECF subfamily)
LGGDESLAEDLLQNSLKKAIEYPATSTERQSVLAWFHQILRTALVDHFRVKSAGTRKIEEFTRESDLHADEQVNSPDELRSELCRCFEGLLPALKPSYAELIRRIDLQEEPLSDVARTLGITENNLSVRLYRARQALKTSLKQACRTLCH